MKLYLQILYLSILLLNIVRCGNDTDKIIKPDVNNPPFISNFTMSNNIVEPDDSVLLKIEAKDPDNDPLFYQWNCNGGKIISGEYLNEAIWKAPSNKGIYKIIVTISDYYTFVSKDTSVTVDPIPRLFISNDKFNLGDTGISFSFKIINIGGRTLDWQINKSTKNIQKCEKTSGNLNYEEEDSISCQINRKDNLPGNFSDSIFISSNGGSDTILIFWSVKPRPILYLYPDTIVFKHEDNTSSLTIGNSGTLPLDWWVETSKLPRDVNVEPLAGHLEPEKEVTAIINISRIDARLGYNYRKIFINSNGGNDSVTLEIQVSGLEIDKDTIFLEGFQDKDTFNFINTGAGDVDYKIIKYVDWIIINKTEGYVVEGGKESFEICLYYIPTREGYYTTDIDVIWNDLYKKKIKVKWNAPFRIFDGLWAGSTSPQLKSIGFSIRYDYYTSEAIVYSPYCASSNDRITVQCSGAISSTNFWMDLGEAIRTIIDSNNYFKIDLTGLKVNPESPYFFLENSYIDGKFIHSDEVKGKMEINLQYDAPGITCQGSFNFTAFPVK